MKFLPGHSECPHCKTVYRFKDINKLSRKGDNECYHCKKTFRVSRRSCFILAAEMMLVYVIINLIAVGMMHTVSLIPLFIMNLIPAITAVLLFPYYTELIKSDKKEKKGKK